MATPGRSSFGSNLETDERGSSLDELALDAADDGRVASLRWLIEAFTFEIDL
jgi:hypothetical protein